MAKIFFDTNYVVGLVNRIPETDTEILNNHEGFISALSCHILFYINKIAVPDEKTNAFLDDFNIVDLTNSVLRKALEGPTGDLEDNIQLLSAIENDCEYFLTADKKLLKMKYFGRLQIVNTLAD